MVVEEVVKVCRRRDDGGEARDFRWCCHDRLRECCARSLAGSKVPALAIWTNDEELERGGVG